MQKENIEWRDLAPSDYHFFSPMKKDLRNKCYTNKEEVQTVVMKWLKEQSTEFYEVGILSLIRR